MKNANNRTKVRSETLTCAKQIQIPGRLAINTKLNNTNQVVRKEKQPRQHSAVNVFRRERTRTKNRVTEKREGKSKRKATSKKGKEKAKRRTIVVSIHLIEGLDPREWWQGWTPGSMHAGATSFLLCSGAPY